MRADWSDIIVTDGTRRDERLPHPLEDGYFRIADRDTAGYLALLSRAARQIRFVGADNVAAGSWHRLFLSDPICALSEIAAIDTAAEAREFEARLRSDWRGAAGTLRERAAFVSAWFDRAGLAPADRSAPMRPDGELGALIEALRAAEEPRDVVALCVPHSAEGDPVARAHLVRDGLRSVHGDLMSLIAMEQPRARQRFAARLTSRRIDPALGLLLAEIRAAEKVGAHLDALPGRIVDFYQRDMLGQAPRPADREHLLLHLAATTRAVYLPEGTPVSRRAGGRVTRYRTTGAIHAVPARVTQQAILRYDRDPRISFSTSLGGITGIRAETIDGEGGRDARHVFDPDPAARVEMGLAIQSPMLTLAEGRRRIEIEVQLDRHAALDAHDMDIAHGSGRDADLELALRADPELVHALGFRRMETGIATLAARAQEFAAATGRPLSMPLLYEAIANDVVTATGLRALLGRIVTLILIEGMPWPAGRFWASLSQKIAGAGPALSGQRMAHGVSPPVSLIAEAFRRNADDTGFAYSTEDVFEMLLGDAFEITLSTASGTVAPDIARVLPNRAGHPPGFTLRLQLDPGTEPIVPPEGAAAPVLTLRLAPQARVCPQSFFEAYRLDKLRLRVRADGLRKLTGFTDEGPVDVAQTFPAFGNRPRDGASLIVAAPEMAMKPVRRVDLAIDWADLPGKGRGFAVHYADYGRDLSLPDPTVTADYLSGDGWKPLSTAPLPLFEQMPGDTGLKGARRFSTEVLGNSVPARNGASGPARSRGALQAGAVRLTLAGSADGFLADMHAGALMRSMRPGYNPLGRPRRAPPEPFVPRIARVTLGYTAESVIALNATDAARPGDRVVQIAPFGRTEIYPRALRRGEGIFVRRLGYGARFIALDGAALRGPISLLFEIDESGHRRVAGPRVPIAFRYLTEAGWSRLPDASVLSDSTDGLMRSGVVTLDLPRDAVRNGAGMPPSGYWIAAVAEAGDIDSFPRLERVRANGVWLRRLEGAPPDMQEAATFTLDTPVTGLGTPELVRRTGRRRAAEPDRAFRARISETLRHRGRAVTAWDMERMVLDAFPDVWLAKCFPHLDRRGPAPGRVTVIVVPDAPATSDGAAPKPRFFDAAALRRIAAHLTDHAAPEARIEVANPAYEVLQVRARVATAPHVEDGALMQRLSALLTRQLSVWTADDALSNFGWSLEPAALRTRLRSEPSVREITEFSILHLVHDDRGTHDLADTARTAPGGNGLLRLRPRLPWGLALSAREHVLTAASDTRPAPAEPSGIGGLRLGDMLVVKPGAVA